jgi:OmpA family
VTAAAALAFGAAAARAEDASVTEQQILKALTPEKKPLSCGLSIGPKVEPAASAAEDKFVQTIGGRTTRSVSLAKRKSLPSVRALGRAPSNADLKGATFIVAGHTDAAGGEAFNQELSERRAAAIK